MDENRVSIVDTYKANEMVIKEGFNSVLHEFHTKTCALCFSL